MGVDNALFFRHPHPHPVSHPKLGRRRAVDDRHVDHDPAQRAFVQARASTTGRGLSVHWVVARRIVFGGARGRSDHGETAQRQAWQRERELRARFFPSGPTHLRQLSCAIF